MPRQHSSGGKQTLLGFSKRGDKYLRSLLVHGARAVIQHASNKEDVLSRWVMRLIERRGKNKATVALANKLARIAWVISARGVRYEPGHATGRHDGKYPDDPSRRDGSVTPKGKHPPTIAKAMQAG